MATSSERTLLTITMDLSIVWAVLVTAGIVVRYFGVLASTDAGAAYLRLAHVLTLPLGFVRLDTPYGGTFEVNAAFTVGLLLVAEWLMSLLRRHV